VTGIAPSTIELAYAAGTPSPLVRAFAGVAREVRDLHRPASPRAR